MITSQLHRAQIAILRSLRHSQMASYSLLMHRANMESDVFKFHIRKLMHAGYIEKLPSGGYRLTLIGKEFANNLDKSQRTIQKQPKLSLMLVVAKPDPQGTLYLFQQRWRQPHWGYWGFLSGPLRWGVHPEIASTAELQKQTGLDAEFETAAFFRQRDYNAHTHELLEDKLFQVMTATQLHGEISQDYAGGHCEWLTIDQILSKDKYFELTATVIAALNSGQTYFAKDVMRQPDDY